MIERQRKTLPGLGPVRAPEPINPISEGIRGKPVAKVEARRLDLDIGDLEGQFAADDMKKALRNAGIIRAPEGFDLQAFIKIIEVASAVSTDQDGQRYQLIEDNFGCQYRIYIAPGKKVSAPGLVENTRVVLQVGEEVRYLFRISFER
jgi:hypothetical protein